MVHAKRRDFGKGLLKMSKPANHSKRQTAKRSRSRRRIAEEIAIDVLDRMPDAIVTLDPEWRYTYVNRAAERIAQRSR
jgi:PAS domain-containing protein